MGAKGKGLKAKPSKTFKKIQVVKNTNKFDEAVQVAEAPLRQPNPNEARVKVHFAGVCAADVAIAAGAFFQKPTPYDLGLEAVGRIELMGADFKAKAESQGLKEDSAVLYVGDAMGRGYTEYLYITDAEMKNSLFPIPEIKPKYQALGISGLTAAIGLSKGANLKKGETVLVTAAAGGLGHMVVQWAKNQGAHVIGTTSSPEKVELAKSLGCDRVINYKTEDLGQVLKKEYPKGIDVVWETVDGKTRSILAQNLSPNGRLINIGSTSVYTAPPSKGGKKGLRKGSKGSKKSAEKGVGSNPKEIRFIIFMNAEHYGKYLKQLVELVQAGKIKPQVDLGEKAPDGPFKSVQDVPRAMNWLYSRQNQGKVVVQIHQCHH